MHAYIVIFDHSSVNMHSNRLGPIFRDQHQTELDRNATSKK